MGYDPVAFTVLALVVLSAAFAFLIPEGSKGKYASLEPPIQEGREGPLELPTAFSSYYSQLLQFSDAERGYQGDLGEMIAGIILARSRWLPIPSKRDKVHGIDGIYFRLLNDKNQTGVEVLFTECKTNAGREELWKLSSDALCERLNSQEANEQIDPQLAMILRRAVKADKHCIKRLHWWIHLISGEVEIVEVDAAGSEKFRRRLPPQRELLQTLSLGLSRVYGDLRKHRAANNPPDEAQFGFATAA